MSVIFPTPDEEARLSHDQRIALEAQRYRNARAKAENRRKRRRLHGPTRRHGGRRTKRTADPAPERDE